MQHAAPEHNPLERLYADMPQYSETPGSTYLPLIDSQGLIPEDNAGRQPLTPEDMYMPRGISPGLNTVETATLGYMGFFGKEKMKNQ